MEKLDNKHFVYRFFIEPQYRIWRHLLVVITLVIITFNQVFIAYEDVSDELGYRIYLIGFSSFILYIATLYLNYFVLVPQLFFKDKYITYLVVLSLMVFLLPVFALVEEYWVRSALSLPHRISSYTNPLILIDSLALFVITIICFLGSTMIVLFRRWMAGKERVIGLENEHLKSEVNKLKGQVTPAFLSKTLKKIASEVKRDPQKATEMLMLLGQLLRYQLYDCNRDRVLLRSEITFLSNFLALEKLNNDRFVYSIHTEGNPDNVFLSPMLFIPLLQYQLDDIASLEVSFQVEKGSLFFYCKSGEDRWWSQNERDSIQRRFELLYPGQYKLTLDARITELRINLPE
ncbi:MAG: histidine kinase [Bacteroidales bacterium]|nr:histidine kinase [Bacteroidales bacterium]